MFSADENSVKSFTVASVHETSEIVQNTFSLDKGAFNGFGVFYSQFLDFTIPKIDSSIKNSTIKLESISAKIEKTKKQINKITIQRLREQKSQKQNST